MKSLKIIPGYKYFESQEDDEQIIFVVRKHWTTMATPFIAAAFILLLTAIIIWLITSFENIKLTGTGETILACIVSIVVLFATLYAFTSWLLRYLNVLILTGEHLVEIRQLALFSRKVSELDLDCIEDASSIQKGFIPTIMHFGRVTIQTAGELPNFDLNNLGDPDGIQQKIMEAKECYMKCNIYNKTGEGSHKVPVEEAPVN